MVAHVGAATGSNCWSNGGGGGGFPTAATETFVMAAGFIFPAPSMANLNYLRDENNFSCFEAKRARNEPHLPVRGTRRNKARRGDGGAMFMVPKHLPQSRIGRDVDGRGRRAVGEGHFCVDLFDARAHEPTNQILQRRMAGERSPSAARRTLFRSRCPQLKK